MCPDRIGRSGPYSDLRMSTDQRDLQVLARLPDLPKNVSHHSFCSALLWQEEGGQEPARCPTHSGDIVGIDRHRIVANSVEEQVGSDLAIRRRSPM